MRRKSLPLVSLAVLATVAGCATEPEGSVTVPHSVSFLIAIDAPSDVHDIDYDIFNSTRVRVAHGTLSGGGSVSVALYASPGRYTVAWPDTLASSSDATVVIAPQEKYFDLSDTTTVVRASAKLEPLTSAVTFHAILDSAPPDLEKSPIFYGSFEGNGTTSGFHTQTNVEFDRLIPGTTYTATWPETGSVDYRPDPNGPWVPLAYPIRATQHTFVFTAPSAGWSAASVQDVHYAVAGSFIYTTPTQRPIGIIYYPPATAVWRENTEWKTLSCKIGSETNPCGPFPVGIPVSLIFWPAKADYDKFVTTPDSTHVTVQPVFKPAVVYFTYTVPDGD